VRHDVPVLLDPDLSSTTSSTTSPPGHPAPRIRAWVWSGLTGVLVVATCLTVALYASAWLIPPYLVAMVFILGVPQGLRLWMRPRGEHTPTRAAGAGATDSRVRRATRPDPAGFDPDATSSAADAADDAPASPPDAPGSKPRRGRGRGRKTKPGPVFEPTGVTATWVRVGPGKFVRADAATNPPEDSSEPPGPEPDPEPVAAVAADDSSPADAAREPEVQSHVEASVDDSGEPWPERGPVAPAGDAQGDNGIAPDAPDALATGAPAEWPEPGPDPVAPLSEGGEAPSACASAVVVDPVSRRMPGRLVAVARGGAIGRRGVSSARIGARAPVAPRWNARAGRSSRVFPGLLGPLPLPARRNRRHSGRFHHADRTHPPRSPPVVAPA
jgi:hypothetical protein